MADALFPKCKAKWMAKDAAAVDLDADDIRVMLVLSTYVYDATDEFLADLGAVDNGRSGALAGKSVDAALAVFDTTDSTLNATAGSASNALIVFRHTGADATADLIAYIDDVAGLPFTPEAAQVCPIVWNNGANKVFRL